VQRQLQQQPCVTASSIQLTACRIGPVQKMSQARFTDLFTTPRSISMRCTIDAHAEGGGGGGYGAIWQRVHACSPHVSHSTCVTQHMEQKQSKTVHSRKHTHTHDLRASIQTAVRWCKLHNQLWTDTILHNSQAVHLLSDGLITRGIAGASREDQRNCYDASYSQQSNACGNGGVAATAASRTARNKVRGSVVRAILLMQ